MDFVRLRTLRPEGHKRLLERLRVVHLLSGK